MKSLQMEWVKLGAVAGLVGGLSYFGTQIPVIPIQIARLMAFSFGPWLIIWAVGIYVFLSLSQKSISAQIGAIFIGIAGFTVNIMLVIQQSIFSILEGYGELIKEVSDPAAKDSLRMSWHGIHAVHYGLDVSFDIFLMVGLTLLSIAMLSHPRFGKILAIPGILLNLAALFINLSTFPIPPGSEDYTYMDLGPFIGLWCLVVAIQMMRSLKWTKNKIEEARVKDKMVMINSQ